MFSAFAAVAINQLLQREAWAREKLLPFAGKCARLAVPPAAFTLSVQADGHVKGADGAAPDVTITVAAGSLPEVLRDPAGAISRAEVTGDSEFAGAISYLFTHLRWDFEEDLSKLVGDVAAHRIAGFGREAAQVPGRVAESVSRSITAYLQEERGTVPSADEVKAFNSAVDVLRDDVARVEKRLDRLQPRSESGG